MWLIAELTGADLRSPAFGNAPSRAITLGQVMFTSTVAALTGWGLLAALERVTHRARPLWRATATVVLLLSLGGPMSGSAITAANRWTLVMMHLAVGAVLIPLLPRRSVPPVAS